MLVMLIAVGALAWLALQAPTRSGAAATPRTSAVQLGSIQSTVGASGNVQAGAAWSVGFDTAGKLSQVLVKVGDKVERGTPLATEDATNARATLAQTRSALGTAQSRLASAQAAVATATATNANSATDTVLAAQDAVNSAADKVTQAQAALDMTTLKAPAAGTITAAAGVVGQQVGAGGVSAAATSSASSTGTGASAGAASSTSGTGSLFTIADLSSLQLKATLAEADSTKVKAGQPAAVAFDALADVKLAGKVASLALTATVSSNVVSYETVITLVNPPATVRSGMTATATITTASRDGVLRIPTAALRGSGANVTVSVLNGDGTQATKRVVAGMRGDDAVEIVSGLSMGDKVVTSSGATPIATTTPSRSGANRPGGAGGGGFGGGGLGGGPPGGGGGHGG